MITKIGVFLSSNNEDNKCIKKADVLLNKFEISSEKIKAKIYICKIFKISFYIIFSKSWSLISDMFDCNKQYVKILEVYIIIK